VQKVVISRNWVIDTKSHQGVIPKSG